MRLHDGLVTYDRKERYNIVKKFQLVLNKECCTLLADVGLVFSLGLLISIRFNYKLNKNHTQPKLSILIQMLISKFSIQG